MAPLIAGIVSTLISNNLPKVAQAVVDKGLDYVEEKTGVKLSPEMSPESIIELRLAAMKHEEFRIEQDNQNTADARSLQKTALSQDDRFSKRYIYYLSTFWSVFATVYISAVTFLNIPPENIRVVDTVIGFVLGTIVATIVNYFFGSSSGSATKNKLLDKEGKL
jgi:hypothetical protein